MKITLDTDATLLKILKQSSAITSAISGGIYAGDDGRPDNSEKEDIVVNTIDLTQEYLPQLGASNVNIHVPDMKLLINGVTQKKANRERLTQLTSLVIETLKAVNIPGVSLVVTNQTVLAQKEISQHFSNIRIDWVLH